MGHYDSAYEHDDKIEREKRKKAVKEAIALINGAIDYSNHAENEEQYVIKLKEAIFWLNNE